jgi:hypothetical protein
VASIFQRLLPRMRFPQLFALLAGLLVVDLLVPDPIPLIDEITLALLTLLVGSWRTRRDPQPPPRDITPPDDEDPPRLPGDSGASG